MGMMGQKLRFTRVENHGHIVSDHNTFNFKCGESNTMDELNVFILCMIDLSPPSPSPHTHTHTHTAWAVLTYMAKVSMLYIYIYVRVYGHIYIWFCTCYWSRISACKCA
ncbi:hypothetical protein N9L68_06980 [bacterium]|nr:hypothetical protein [bacterium]